MLFILYLDDVKTENRIKLLFYISGVSYNKSILLYQLVLVVKK